MLKVKYTKLAIKDLEDSYNYIYSKNSIAARSVIEKIETTISKLSEFPLLGHKCRVENTFEFNVLSTPFLIVYMVDNDFLKIISILHTSRKFP